MVTTLPELISHLILIPMLRRDARCGGKGAHLVLVPEQLGRREVHAVQAADAWRFDSHM